MPQGGGATTSNSTSAESTSANQQLFQQIREGTSWSGNEQNTFFLSAGAANKFFDVSTASGFDFPDDARGMTPVDWDGDGDLDFITSNRNGPQVRFLNNDIPRGKFQTLGIRLVGKGKVNRDAIGSRVTVHIPGQPPLMRTVRAGEGFQAQNSKWLHFGLGDASGIERVEVRWAGGETQTFLNLESNHRYKLTLGNQTAAVEPPRQISWPSDMRALLSDASGASGQAFTASKLPVPTLPYVSFKDADVIYTPGQTGNLTLVNLWASWCLPCVKELREFQSEAETLKSANVDILALSIEGVGEADGETAKAKAFLEKLKFSFPAGVAKPETLEKIKLLHNLIFEKRGQITLPTSLLIDREGRLAAYYEGPISTQQVLAFAKRANESAISDRLNAAIPFEGRWLKTPAAFRFSDYGNQLLASGFLKDAGWIAKKFAGDLQLDSQQHVFLAKLGIAFEKAGNAVGALPFFESAVKAGPRQSAGYITLANRFMKQNMFAKAVSYFREGLEIDPSLNDVRYNLALVLKRNNDFAGAEKEFLTVVQNKPDHALAYANLAAMRMQKKDLDTAIKYLKLSVESKPDFHPVRFQLGRLLEEVGKKAAAIAQYEQLLELEPKFTPAVERLRKLKTAK